jgi:hypothetical protein
MISILQSLHLPFVVTVSHCSTGSIDKGGDDNAALLLPFPILQTILKNNGWVLLPMKVSTSDSDLASSSLLGEILVDALDKTRALLASLSKSSNNNSNVTPCTTSNNDAVLFLGMDSPELPLEEIVFGLQLSSGTKWIHHNDDAVINGVHNGKAHLCPANDGGYGLLSIPKHAPSVQIFSRVRWSHSLTAMSQLKALTDCNIDVSIGTLMYDIDEPDDVHDLVTRLVQLNNSNTRLSSFTSDQRGDPLTRLSAGINGGVTTEDIQPCLPRNTWRTLIELNLIKVDE